MILKLAYIRCLPFDAISNIFTSLIYYDAECVRRSGFFLQLTRYISYVLAYLLLVDDFIVWLLGQRQQLTALSVASPSHAGLLMWISEQING